MKELDMLTGARVCVWVDGWQQQCCGELWTIGGVVTFTVAEPDDEYLKPLFDPASGIRIEWCEEHHADDEQAARLQQLTGVIVAIDAVQLSYAASGEGRDVIYPVAGSALLTPLTQSEGDELQWEGFAGYVVTLQT